MESPPSFSLSLGGAPPYLNGVAVVVSASRALKRAKATGEPLPLPHALQPLVQRGAKFRRGHLVMIAAMPNAGKSAFAQWVAAQVNEPTLYFSADQDAFTTTTRLAATLSGHTLDSVEQMIGDGGSGEAYYDELLSSCKVSFCFDSNPAIDDIMLEIDAWVEMWDSYPSVIVVDNLLNVEGGGDREGEMWVIEQLHSLARRTMACVILLVHASEAQGDPNKPVPRKAILNKVTQLPDLILTVALDGDTFWMANVKCREGKSDPKAEEPLAITSDFSRQMFYPYSPPTYGGWQ